jgi:hypothetical protein
MTIEIGSTWQSKQAHGRRDAIVFTVRGVTDAGVYVTPPESRSPGNLYSPEQFVRLFLKVTVGPRCGALTAIDGVWRLVERTE